MSQSSPTIGAGKSGADYRSEDNDGKTALLNHHKGATAPTYAEAGCVWLDDTATPWLLKMHDGTDWITVTEVDATTNEAKPYVNGAVLGDASETVKGLIELATDAEIATGTAIDKVPTVKQLADNLGEGGLVLLAAATAMSDTSVDFTADIDSTYEEYQIHYNNVVASTANASLVFQMSDDTGMTFKSGGSDYGYLRSRLRSSSSGAMQTAGTTAAAYVLLTPFQVGNSTSTHTSGVVTIHNPAAGLKVSCLAQAFSTNSSGEIAHAMTSGRYNTVAAIDAFRVKFASGNITSGEFKLYGVKKA